MTRFAVWNNERISASFVLVAVSGCLCVYHTHATPLYSCNELITDLRSIKYFVKSASNHALYPMNFW